MLGLYTSMRPLVLGTFVIDGVGVVTLIGRLAFSDVRMTAFDGFLVAALILGFFTALGMLILSEDAPPQAETDNASPLLLAGAAMFDALADADKQRVRTCFPSPPPHPTIRLLDQDVEPAMLLGVAILHGTPRRLPPIVPAAPEMPAQEAEPVAPELRRVASLAARRSSF